MQSLKYYGRYFEIRNTSLRGGGSFCPVLASNKRLWCTGLGYSLLQVDLSAIFDIEKIALKFQKRDFVCLGAKMRNSYFFFPSWRPSLHVIFGPCLHAGSMAHRLLVGPSCLDSFHHEKNPCFVYKHYVPDSFSVSIL